MATVLNQSIILPSDQGIFMQMSFCFNEWNIESLNDRSSLLMLLILPASGRHLAELPASRPRLAPEYGTSPRWSCISPGPRQSPASCTMVKAAPAPALSWPRPPVFTFLRPSPGGKLARIIVYKITIQLSNSGMRLIRPGPLLSVWVISEETPHMRKPQSGASCQISGLFSTLSHSIIRSINVIIGVFMHRNRLTVISYHTLLPPIIMYRYETGEGMFVS